MVLISQRAGTAHFSFPVSTLRYEVVTIHFVREVCRTEQKI